MLFYLAGDAYSSEALMIKIEAVFLWVKCIGLVYVIHNRCNIFPGLSYNKANCTFLNSIRNNDDESQIEFTLKVMERALVTCY